MRESDDYSARTAVLLALIGLASAAQSPPLDERAQRRVTPEVLVVREASPAVVYIVSTGYVTGFDIFGQEVRQENRSAGTGVLVDPDGPVIIDLPQVVNAAGNNSAFALLERDVNNLRSTLGRFAAELETTEYAREMWSLFEQGELKPDTVLTGVFVSDEIIVNPQDVMLVIDDAREEEIQRQLRRAAPEAA